MRKFPFLATQLVVATGLLGMAPLHWINPNVPSRIPFIQPANYPNWTDEGVKHTPGTPNFCDPTSFLEQFSKGNALAPFFQSNQAREDGVSDLKPLFNGHPIAFPSGNILFPVGVGRVKEIEGSGSKLLRDIFDFEKSKADQSGFDSVQDDPSLQNCTTYLNQGNQDAQRDFQWLFIPVDMKGKTTDPAKVAETAKVYDDVFLKVLPRMLQCEEKFHYYAFGCQSAFERTPTILAMFLKELGCSTKNSVFIADMQLGRNDIPLETRSAIVEQTPIDPATQKELQRLFFNGEQ